MAQSSLPAFVTQVRTAGGRQAIFGQDGGEVISPMTLRSFGRLFVLAPTRQVLMSETGLQLPLPISILHKAVNVATK